MGTDRAISNWVTQLETSTSPAAIRRVSAKAGAAGKKAGLRQVQRKLGSDMAMSNFRPRGKPLPLKLGYDTRADGVDFNFRPKGPWVLASSGRKASGIILPTRDALLTPFGFKAWSGYDPSKGTGVLGVARSHIETDVPKAAFRQFQREIGKALRG